MATRTIGRFVAVSMLCLGLLGVPAQALPEPDAAKAPSKPLSLHANQSVLVDTAFDIKRVSIARPETADVMVVSPRQMLVIGKAAGTTSLVYWSQEEAPTIIEVTVGINLDLVKKDLGNVAPGEQFEVTAAGEKLVLTGTIGDNVVLTRLVEAAQPYAKGVVNLLTLKKVEQVLLQVRVSEVDRTIAKELGINYFYKSSNYSAFLNPPNSFSTPGGTYPGDATLPISDMMNVFFANTGQLPNFATFLRALDDKGGLKILAEPNLIVANGAAGNILVGGEFPIVINTATGGTAAYSVQYKDYGVRLGFQPKISTNGEIYLQISQEVSELDYANAVVLQGFRIPALKIRKAESGLQLADGQTFLLAGLIDNKVSKQITQLPLLGDIPILGALFRNTRYQNNETELMVMVTPKIVRSLNPDEIPVLPSEKVKPEELSPKMIW